MGPILRTIPVVVPDANGTLTTEPTFIALARFVGIEYEYGSPR
jgi:hypothetical protein